MLYLVMDKFCSHIKGTIHFVSLKTRQTVLVISLTFNSTNFNAQNRNIQRSSASTDYKPYSSWQTAYYAVADSVLNEFETFTNGLKLTGNP